MSIETIEQLTRMHAADRAALAERMQKYQDEVEQIKRRKLPGIKLAVSAAKDSHLRLHAAISAERDLFSKPKTRVFHGIKVGLQKAKGKLTYYSLDSLLKTIRKQLPEQFDVLVKTRYTPIKNALINLPAAELKKLGCEVADTGDEVVIAPADGEIDKLVDALLNGNDDVQEEDAA